MPEVVFANESVEIVLLPDRGARIHRLRVFGHDLLRTAPSLDAYDREPFFWGWFVMAPWCNRIGVEPVRVGSRTVRPISNFSDGYALHGQVFERPWSQVSLDTFRISAGGDAWPWEYEVSQRVVMDESVVRLEQRLVNRSSEPMPGGIGVHPWFRGPVQVAVRADLVHESNVDSSAQPMPVRSRFDLRRLAEAAPGLDGAWTALGEPPVALEWPTLGIRATMRTIPPVPYLVAATPPDLGGIAVEPQTHAPQGMRRLLLGEPGGLTVIAPGQSIPLDVEVDFRRVP